MKRAASIRQRLSRALLLSALAWSSVLAVAVWLPMREEVDELLDDALQSAAEGMVDLLAVAQPAPASSPPPAGSGGRRFVWQLVSHHDGARLLRQSAGAPAAALHATPTPGLSDVAGWRVFGQPLGHDGQMVYVAQTRAERGKAESAIGFAVLLAGLPMVLLALLWLRARVRHELQPLQVLSERLAHFDPLQPGATLGTSEHEELRPVQAAIDALAGRLADRVAREHAFTAHAAHALRTPLAGIDAQLAVALREAPAPLQPRLQRVRAAAGRLQRVVAALLALFRSGSELQRVPLDLATLAARLPVEGLALSAEPAPPLSADVDLLVAALLNLLDNALRHGAKTVTLSSPQPGVLAVQDDGEGVTPERRRDLAQALEQEQYEGRTGLGLMLADLVARAHGGQLQLPPAPVGFTVWLVLGPQDNQPPP